MTVKYFFISITPKSTLTRSDSPSYSPVYGSNTSVLGLFVFDGTMCKKVRKIFVFDRTVCKKSQKNICIRWDRVQKNQKIICIRWDRVQKSKNFIRI